MEEKGSRLRIFGGIIKNFISLGTAKNNKEKPFLR